MASEDPLSTGLDAAALSRAEGAESRRATLGLVSLYDIENNATRLLAAAARKAGHRVIEVFFKDWVNNRFIPPHAKELQHLVTLLATHRVDVVALSVRASAYHRVASVLTELLRVELGVPVLWGGTHVILSPEDCIREADAICVGEGDVTVVEMLECIARGQDFSDLSNLWVRNGEDVRRNPVRSLVGDLDSVPFRDYASPDKFWIQGRRVKRGDPMVDDPTFQMMCSRGCVYACSYCYNSRMQREVYRGKGSYYRFRSVDNVLEEIKQARSVFRSMKRIRFDDEVFVFDGAWLEEFIERYPREVGLPFEIFVEPRLVDPDMFRRLRQAGLGVVHMGVQNTYRVNDEVYDRHTPENRARSAVELFHELGIEFRIQVIVDDPFSTSSDKENLFDFLLSFPRPFELYLFSIVVFPNTTLARKLKEQNLITDKDVEGENTKTFQQMRVSLNWPRPAEDTFWCCMLVLVTKGFLPKGFLRVLSRVEILRKHPGPLVWFAQACNVVKMVGVCARLVARGELTWTLVRRWANPGSMISQ